LSTVIVANHYGGLIFYRILAKITSTMPTRRGYYDEFLTKRVLKQEYVTLRKSSTVIGEQFGLSGGGIVLYLKRYNIARRNDAEKRRRYRKIDVRPFLELMSDNYAYWLGFLAADGCVYNWKGKVAFRLKLSLKDFQHLRRFHRLLRSDAPTPIRHDQGYHSVQLDISDRQFTDALAKWGIVPNKTENLAFPKNLPPSLISAYVRGYFDGDGTVYQRRDFYKGKQRKEIVCRFISGSSSFLFDLAAILNANGIITNKMYRNQNSNAFVLPLSSKHENLQRFVDYLYTGATCSLLRKRKVFQEAAA